MQCTLSGRKEAQLAIARFLGRRGDLGMTRLIVSMQPRQTLASKSCAPKASVNAQCKLPGHSNRGIHGRKQLSALREPSVCPNTALCLISL
jgi:hypothetical protein